jgi:hypothetical protein
MRNWIESFLRDDDSILRLLSELHELNLKHSIVPNRHGRDV